MSRRKQAFIAARAEELQILADLLSIEIRLVQPA